jgi:hypothetical protein
MVLNQYSSEVGQTSCFWAASQVQKFRLMIHLMSDDRNFSWVEPIYLPTFDTHITGTSESNYINKPRKLQKADGPISFTHIDSFLLLIRSGSGGE